MDPLSEDDVDHLEEDKSGSDEYSPELDEEAPNKVTDTCNKPVPSTSKCWLSFKRSCRALWWALPCFMQFCSCQSLPRLKYYNK